MNYVGLKEGTVVEWTNNGYTRTGTVIKVNRKTVEVVDIRYDVRTVTRVPTSMITGILDE